jgi:hypothetical protein
MAPASILGRTKDRNKGGAGTKPVKIWLDKFIKIELNEGNID